MKYYLGVDIGKYYHQALLCDVDGKKVLPSLKFSADYQGWKDLRSYLEKRIDEQDIGTVHAGMEATGPYWVSLYDKLQELGVRVTVLNPLQVKSYRNEGIRGSKNDRIDAHLLVKVLRFGDYNESDIPNGDLLALKQLTRLRWDLVNVTSSLKRRVISIFDRIFPEYRDLFKDIFSTSSRALLEESVLPCKIANLDTEKLTKLLRKASRGRLGKDKANHIKDTASKTMGSRLALDAFSVSVEVLLAQIAHIEKQIKRLESEILERLDEQQTNLTTIPGIGKTTAATIVAEIGNFSRIANLKDGADKLVALAGLDPKIKESGTYKGKAKMSKRGSSYLRTAIWQATTVAVHVAHDPMFESIYQKKISEGKPYKVAISHVTNKMLHVVYSLLKSGKPYEPHV